MPQNQIYDPQETGYLMGRKTSELSLRLFSPEYDCCHLEKHRKFSQDIKLDGLYKESCNIMVNFSFLKILFNVQLRPNSYITEEMKISSGQMSLHINIQQIIVFLKNIICFYLGNRQFGGESKKPFQSAMN